MENADGGGKFQGKPDLTVLESLGALKKERERKKSVKVSHFPRIPFAVSSFYVIFI
jgi:hypothetical protein